VFGLITPWNLPLYLHSWKVAPALAMGNTVVAKPSELTPTTASLLAEVTQTVGLPAGVYNLVHGYGHEAGQAIVEHPDIKGISFTGGTQTGETVARTAAPMFKKLSLELGGKNPTIVFADADFDKAVAGAVRAAFLNQGQICLCGSRVLVERSVHDRFVEAMAARTSSLRVGPPSDPNSNLGALVSHAHRDKIASYVALGREEGGTVRCGGKVPALPAPFTDGAFYEPTVISGLPATCRTSTEEIFGPVVTVHPFDSEDEAIAMANGVRYGLAASVWTEDLRRAHRVSAALRTGMVWVNTWLKRDLRVPFGGVKDSGVGREGGSYSLSFYSEDKNVCIQLD
jgi:aminomuconate-semialdehyde/2-hydroxymuconate-6-semialdehyde dehydrogenase